MDPIASIDESARLVLMEYAEHAQSVTRHGVAGLLRPRMIDDFVNPMRKLHPTADSLTITELWKKYMGLDGRLAATHCFVCGKPMVPWGVPCNVSWM